MKFDRCEKISRLFERRVETNLRSVILRADEPKNYFLPNSRKREKFLQQIARTRFDNISDNWLRNGSFGNRIILSYILCGAIDFENEIRAEHVKFFGQILQITDICTETRLSSIVVDGHRTMRFYHNKSRCTTNRITYFVRVKT